MRHTDPHVARLWSARLDNPLDHRALTRVRATPLQSGLSATQRVDNLRQAFEYTAIELYRHVAVVGDIVTTGSTVDEITRVLQPRGRRVRRSMGADARLSALTAIGI